MKRSTRLLTMLHFLPASAFLYAAYLNETGHILHLKNPRRFNEKLNALKLCDNVPTWSRYVDKLEARTHVASVIGEEHLVPLIAYYDSVDEIDWSELPQRFVIKCTHGSHCGIVCMDKRLFDTVDAERKLRKWIKTNWYWVGRETPYKAIRPRIMVEEFIGGDYPAQDYKFMCFNGMPRIVQLHTKRDGLATIDFFNMSGQKLAIRKKGYPASAKERIKPSAMCALLPVARKLAAGFPYVRVDLYLHNGWVYFGEMTFFDSAALREFEPEPVNTMLGDMIALPEICETTHAHETCDEPKGGGVLSNESILDMLHDFLKTEYLSDLRYKPDQRRKIPIVLEAIPEHIYNVKNWSDALTYLYGVPLHFDSVYQAKAYCRQNPLPSRIALPQYYE